MSLIYILKRLLLIIINIILTSFFTFFLLSLTPGDPAEILIKKVFIGSEEYSASQQELQGLKKNLHLHDPILKQYFIWFKKALRLNFGYSLVTGFKVSEELLLRLWPSISLALLATGFSIIFTLIISTLYYLSKKNIIKRSIDIMIITFVSLPNFYLALLLIILFSLILNLLPISGYGSLKHYILPALTLSLSMFGYSCKILNDSIEETSNYLFIVTARSKGLKPHSIFQRYILKNSFIPVIPYFGIQTGFLIGSAVFIETIFAFPGIGKYLIDSIDSRDIPAIQITVVLIALIFSIINLTTDIIVSYIDPRSHYKK